jgi:uncharacterized membrane protein YqjE
MGDYEEDQQTGIFASLRRMCVTALQAVYDRVELVSLEAQEEKERLIHLFVFAGVVVFLGNMTAVMLTLTILYLAGTGVRGPLMIVITILYLAGTVWGYLALRKKLTTAPRLFNDTLSELKKDRDWLSNRK